MKNIEQSHNSTTLYTGDRYELAKLMVETDAALNDLSKSLGGTEKLAKIIYDPDMDKDEGSFMMDFLGEITSNGDISGAMTKSITNYIEETKGIMDDKLHDVVTGLPIAFNKELQELITLKKQELGSLSKKQIYEEVKRLEKMRPESTNPEDNIAQQQENNADNDAEQGSHSPSTVTYSESVEIKCDTAPLVLARSYLGTKEGTKTADVFVNAFGSGNSKSTPWCAGFVSYCLKKTGHNFTKNPLRAKSYIGKMGPGHIAFWDKDAGKMIAGNYGNKVAYQKLPKTYKWNTPEEIDKGNYTGFEAMTPEDIPNGAIIIMNRSSSDNDMI